MSGLFGGGVGARELAAVRRLESPLLARPRAERAGDWSEDDDAALRRSWAPGGGGASEAAAVTGRTRLACSARAKRLGLGRASRGLVSVYAVARATGVGRGRAFAVARAAGIPVVRKSPGPDSPHRQGWLTPDAARALATAIARAPAKVYDVRPTGKRRGVLGLWSSGRKPAGCLLCGTTSRPHYAGGYCQRHHETLARAGQRPAPLGAGAEVVPLLPAVPRPLLSGLVRALGRAQVPLSVPELTRRLGGWTKADVAAASAALVGARLARVCRDRYGRPCGYAIVRAADAPPRRRGRPAVKGRAR